MAYAKLMEYKNKLKKKITTIALFSLLVTTTLTDQAVMTLAATQSLPDQPAAIELIDGAEETEEAEEYQAGQIVTIDGVDYEISPVYTEDGKDYFGVEGKLAKAFDIYRKGTECTILFTYQKDFSGTVKECYYLLFADGAYKTLATKTTRNEDTVTYKTQSQLDAEQAEADAAAIKAVENKISAIKVLEGNNYAEVYTFINENSRRAAQTAYDALEERLQGSVSNYDILAKAEEDYKAAGVLYVNGVIADIGTVTYSSDSSSKISNARNVYNSLVNKYPELASQLNYSTIEAAQAEYTKKQNEHTSSLKPSEYFGDSTTQAPAQTQTPAETQAPGSVDNLSGYEVDDIGYL